MSEEKNTVFTTKHVRLLRERLVWCFKRSPPEVQRQIHLTLKQFSEDIASICQHEEKAFVAPENKKACLNCGKRFNVEA